MATYLKRTSKLFDISLSRNSTDVSLGDLICPICRGILIEPVSLPCTHNLCLRCLRGTFAHNSLSCPLCRVRVGSWLRTATKSETLVNNELWQLIRARFPNEVESKYNGDDEDAANDADYAIPNRILSTRGEIRREYEVQLQLAQEELLRQREAERIASEALILKIQAEEQQQQRVQMAEDKLLAKSLARKQITSKNNKEALKYSQYNQYTKPHLVNSVRKEDDTVAKSRAEDGSGFFRKSLSKQKKEFSNTNLTHAFTKPRDHYAISRTLNVNNKEPSTSTAVNMTTKPKKYSPEPGCSNNLKIYGLQSKEELHVPNDVLNSKNKTLGVEVCVTKVFGEEARIGSAESGGSHDSINQEIHHFKPIKAMPRTPLLLNADGRQIDPKLIRVTPIIKRVPHAIPSPPSPTNAKRIIGSSWSAFKRQLKKESPATEVSSKSFSSETSSNPSHTIKAKVFDDCRLTIDTNKNYTKNVNKVINGAKKMSKKSSPIEIEEKPSKNSRFSKSKQRHKRKKESQPSLSSDEIFVENIAERIKHRKTLVPAAKRFKNEQHKDNEKEESSEKGESDDEVIKEQQKIEQIVLQEKQDFELAMRLQAQFDELERMPVRTRGHRKAIESVSQNIDSDDDRCPQRKRRRQTRRTNT